jgi:hypothetical protein
MSNKLEVSFNSPQCGWMSIGFDDGKSEFHTTTAHAPHENALPELLRILTDLLNADSAQNEYLLHWNRNPEEFDFEFVKNGEDVSLTIYQYPTEKARFGNERELVFSHAGNVQDVCRSFGETFNQLYADRETDEFEFNWRQPFPYREYEKFKNKTAIEKRELDD